MTKKSEKEARMDKEGGNLEGIFHLVPADRAGYATGFMAKSVIILKLKIIRTAMI